MAVPRPTVYLVDDENQHTQAAALSSLGVVASWLYPTEVTQEHLQQATLLVVDQYFDLTNPGAAVSEDFDLPTDVPPGIIPRDGLALSAVLRSATPKAGRNPIGICLRSGALDLLTRGLPQGVREPLIAAQHDLEWVVSRDQEDGDPDAQLVSLAHALQSYPQEWPSGLGRETGIAWLGIPEGPWQRLAQSEILQSRPPVVLSDNSFQGLAWLRWLAHRILPFPTFLFNHRRAAVMLGVTPASLAAALAVEDSQLAASFDGLCYRGPLAELQPRRYWRAGLFHLVHELVGADLASEPRSIADALIEQHSDLEPLDLDDPVLGIDPDYRDAEIIDRADAVRLLPEGWPAYADPAWATSQRAAEGDMTDLLAPRLR